MKKKEEIAILKQEWKKKVDEYKSKEKEYNTKIISTINMYNQMVATINSERSGLKTLINQLYKFLGEFGNIGTQITPFEFKNESWIAPIDIDNIGLQKVSGPEETGKEKNATEEQTANVMEAIITGVTMAIMPLNLFPIAMYGTSAALKSLPWNSRKKLQIELEKKTEDYENMRVCCNKNVNIYGEYLKSLELAIEIAKLYYATIGIVKESITEMILPELTGVRAFLYAQSIADKIAENAEPDENVKPIHILEIYGTKYDNHYHFVENAVDYYTIIAEIFKETILTNMTNGLSAIMEKKINTKKQQEEIKKRYDCLNQNAIFTRRR